MYCFEIKFGGKICKIITFLRSPSQSKDDFDTFTGKLELTLDNIFDNNPFLVVGLGDFNAKSD